MTVTTDRTVASTGRPNVVSIADVSKRFVVRRDSSLKERLVTLGRPGRKHREEFWALKNVNFDIEAGTTIGLIGHNGSGKSTLLKVLGGIIDPTDGTVSRRGRIAALLELGAGFHPDLTGRENVFLNASILGLSRAETEERLDDILAFASIGDFIDTQVKFYSSGMYVRLAFAVAVHTDPDILLVDEVLAVGDEAFQRKCMDKIRSFQQEGRTIVLVTHSLGQVVELCDRAVLLNKGAVVYDGEPREAVRAFRNILEGRRLDEVAEAVAKKSEAAPPAARVLSATARAVGSEQGVPLRLGQDLEITAEFEHQTGIDEWIYAVQIDSVQGLKVYGASSDRIGPGMRPLRGRRSVTLTIKAPPLGTGKYFVNVSLMDTSARHLHDLVQGASFDVESPEHVSGIVYAEASFGD